VRKTFLTCPVAVILFAACFFFAFPTCAEIRYSISLEHPEQHLFHVTMEVPDVQEHVDLQMAAWDALYQIRDFSSHVQRVSAAVNGENAAIEKLDKLTWRVQGSGTVKVSYDTFWDDQGPFSSQLNAEHAFINPAMVLLYVRGRRAEKCQLSFVAIPAGWGIASALRFGSSQNSAAAQSFAALGDSPI